MSDPEREYTDIEISDREKEEAIFKMASDMLDQIKEEVDEYCPEAVTIDIMVNYLNAAFDFGRYGHKAI